MLTAPVAWVGAWLALNRRRVSPANWVIVCYFFAMEVDAIAALVAVSHWGASTSLNVIFGFLWRHFLRLAIATTRANEAHCVTTAWTRSAV